MKKVLEVIVALSVIALAACSKKHGYAVTHSVVQDNNQDSLVGMDAVIDSVAWHTDSAYAYRVKYSGDSTRMDLYINASRRLNDTVSTIAFTIVNYTGPKNYPIDPPATAATYYKGSERHFATIGSINIVSDTPYSVIGTFNFTADTIVVTNGKFNVAKP